MRDILGHAAHGRHQPLNAVEHRVDVLSEVVVFVAALANRDALRKIAFEHLVRDGVDLAQAAARVKREHRASCRAKQEVGRKRAQQRFRDDRLEITCAR